MASSDVDWLEDTTLPASADYLLALGAFALRFNQMEMLLYSFMRSYFPDDANVCSQVFMALHNRGRVNLILTLIERETDASVREAVTHALTCFDRCVENRSLLMHGFPPTRNPKGDTLTLLKNTASKPTHLNSYRFELADLRSATVELGQVFNYVVDLNAWLRLRAQNRERLPPLPARPREPRKLTQSQLIAAHQA